MTWIRLELGEGVIPQMFDLTSMSDEILYSCVSKFFFGLAIFQIVATVIAPRDRVLRKIGGGTVISLVGMGVTWVLIKGMRWVGGM